MNEFTQHQPISGASAHHPADHEPNLEDDREDDGENNECFEPVLRPVPAPQPIPTRKKHSLISDELLSSLGILPPQAATEAETAPSCEVPLEPEPPPRRLATATELVTWIKQVLLARAPLAEDAAVMVAFWVIGTWFPKKSNLIPCLVITGPAHHARRVLHFLKDFCMQTVLLGEFRRSNLDVLRQVCSTLLIAEPTLDKRTARLLGNLTDPKSILIEAGYVMHCSMSTAIYAGENPETYPIENSIHVHLAESNAPDVPADVLPAQSLENMLQWVPIHLAQYREENLAEIERFSWTPAGLGSETWELARELGRSIVAAPLMRRRLVELLKIEDRQRFSDRTSTPEALVVQAARALSREGRVQDGDQTENKVPEPDQAQPEVRDQAYVQEIASEVNRLYALRGEPTRLSPEKVGHRLKKLGLVTRPLSQAGHGLRFDSATLARIEQLAAVYTVEDTQAETAKLEDARESKQVV